MATRTAASSRAKTQVAIPQLSWNQVRPAPIVLVSGTESFLAERAIRQLRDFLKLEDPSIEVSDIQADSYAPGELLTLASPSLFNEPRLIRVSNVEKTSDTFLEEILDYIKNPADDTYVILRHGGGVRGKKLLDTLRSGVGGAVEVARPGAEENIDSEKYEYRPRDFQKAEEHGRSLAPFITLLNRIRSEHPALRQLRNLEIHESEDDSILVYSKYLAGEFTANGTPDAILVVANVDPHSVRETVVHLDVTRFGLTPGAQFDVRDLVTGSVWTWSADNYVRLDAFTEPVHILHVTARKELGR